MKRTQVKINAFTFARMMKLMLDGTYTCRELAEETGLHYVTVLRYTREMYRAGAIHISMWETDARGRQNIRVYKVGEGKDAKPKKISNAESAKNYRTKQRYMSIAHKQVGEINGA